jgi:hypothetical protein
MLGRNVTRDTSAANGPVLESVDDPLPDRTTASKKPAAKPAKIVNSTQYQYSDLPARPLNSTYFRKQVDIASPKLMTAFH